MANEYLKHFLDQQGLGIVWEKVKGLVSAEEIRAKAAELALEGLISDEQARAIAAEANKVDKIVAGVQTGDKAIIFNEKDGGGAKYEAADGTASFAGVNSDTNGGIGAQLYDIDVASNKGAKLDVTKNGIFYTKGDMSALPASQRDVSDNEVVVWADIKNIPGGMRFIGVGTLAIGQELEDAIKATYEANGYAYPGDRKVGDIVILNDGLVYREYIYTSGGWEELGDASLYATKEELAAEANVRGTADAALQTNIDAEAATRATEDAKKADLPSELPPELKVPGVDYPWFMVNMEPKSIDAEGNLHLDHSGYNFNAKQYYTWKDKVIPMAATTTTGGLMKAADKDKLDGLIPMTDAEIEAICQ